MSSMGRAVAIALLGTVVDGCMTAPDYVNDADTEVGSLLREVTGVELGQRESWVHKPARAAEPEAGAATASPAGAGVEADGAPAGGEVPSALETLVLDMRSSLAVAVQTSREYLDRKDQVYTVGLSLTLQQFNFGPLFDSTLAYLWSDSKSGPWSTEATASLGVSKILEDGGTLELASLLGTNKTQGVSRTWDSSVDLILTQPLMRGYGYEVSHEALTQAERNMVYEVRDFELFREDFSIAIAADYLDIVSQQQSLVNLRENYRQTLFDMNKAVALRQLDRVRDEDVFIARRREIDTKNNLLQSETNYEQALDDFKIRLGLTVTTPVEVVDVDPPFEPVRLDEDSAIEVALHNRLDLMNAQGRVEDAERGVRNARNALQADLDFVGSFGFEGSDENLSGAAPDNWRASSGLSLDLPLQRTPERNAYRQALIILDQSRRDYTLLRDRIERNVRSQLRDLQQFEEQIALQREQISQEQRAVAISEFRFEAGEVDSRDLLDARLSLTTARNQLIDLTARHFIQRLRLMRDLGILFIDDQGMWRT